MALSAQAGPDALPSDSSSCGTVDDTLCREFSELNGEGNYYYAYTFNSNGLEQPSDELISMLICDRA